MSAANRTLIADALSTVDGVKGQPYYVQTTAAGSATVWLDRIEYPNPWGGVGFYEIRVTLPEGLAAAEKRAEQLVPLLLAALDPVLVVKTVRPVQLISFPGGGAIPCAVITGHREEA